MAELENMLENTNRKRMNPMRTLLLALPLAMLLSMSLAAGLCPPARAEIIEFNLFSMDVPQGWQYRETADLLITSTPEKTPPDEAHVVIVMTNYDHTLPLAEVAALAARDNENEPRQISPDEYVFNGIFFGQPVHISVRRVGELNLAILLSDETATTQAVADSITPR